MLGRVRGMRKGKFSGISAPPRGTSPGPSRPLPAPPGPPARVRHPLIAQGQELPASPTPSTISGAQRVRCFAMDVARLVVPQPGGVKNVALARFPFRIGRHHENDLVLGDADVSR